MEANADRLIEVFNQAKALSPGSARASYLSEACGEDELLHDHVVLLLEADESAGDFLKPQPLEQAAAVTEGPGDRIGRYKLLQKIGEGGGGVVYMAEQEEPVRRRVALKIIKLGMDTRQVVARFEAERQALAVMDHPNIARVFDGGATETGRPFFVMELVRGIKITEYCDQNNFSTEQRLELFVQVCNAIQHAHQKGVIHRDIKPSNILVTLNDGAPVPKVIDFGIAKATEQRLTEKTVFTAFEQFIGTPAYMSPEQAEMSSLDIDTRADIYSLGVLLFELLTGNTPFDVAKLVAAGLDEVRRTIREKEPPKPSTRLAALDEKDLSTVAARRHTDSPKLIHRVRGDLDWIVMKCLEKDRTRRYETAIGLATDLQRHLKSEPVLACPPSAAYRFRKFARRNKAGLAMAAALAAAAVVTISGLALSNWRVKREKNEKERALSRAVQEKERADANLARAREAVKKYLLKTSENPQLQQGDFQGLRKELMETAIPFYEEFVRQDQTDPDLEFERGGAYDDLGFLRQGIGEPMRALDDFEQAKTIFLRLTEQHPDKPNFRRRLAEAHNSRGSVLKDLTRIDEAEREFREAIKVVNPLIASDEANADYRETLARANGNLGTLLKESGRLPEAEEALQESVETREQLMKADPSSLALRGQLSTALNNLGLTLQAERKAEEAKGAYERAIHILDSKSTELVAAWSAEPATLTRHQHLKAQAWNNLGALKKEMSQFVEAEAAYRESLSLKEKLAERYPSIPQHRQELAATYNNVGALVSSQKRPDEARVAYEKAIQIYERLAAESLVEPRYVVLLAGSYSNMGRLIGDEGRLEESLPWITKGIHILEDAMHKDERVAKVRETLCIASWTRAMTLCGLDRHADALKDWDRALEVDDGRHRLDLLLRRGSNLLNVKDHIRAAADGEAIIASPKAAAEDFYNVACLFAICTQMALEDGPRTEAYAARAVALLRLAVKKGYRDAAQLKTTGDLKPLHSREDFQQLIKELEAGAVEKEPDQQ